MKRPLLRIATTLLATAAMATAQPSFDEALRVATRKADIPAEEVARATQAALWNPDKTAVAVALKRPEASVVLVFLRQKSGVFVIVDVSAVESGNFAKLGTGRTHYQRFETTPVKWLHRDDDLFQVVIRTRAWVSGQRSTVSESLLIRPNGNPLWR